VASGGGLTATLTMSAAAPAGGVTVSLASSAPQVIAVPASVSIPSGQASVSVPLQAGPVSQQTGVTLTATMSGRSLQAAVTVQPTEVKPVLALIRKISRSTSQVVPGGSFQLTVELATPAPSGGVLVRFRASDAGVSLPAQAVVSSGSATLTVAGSVSASATSGTAILYASSGNEASTTIRIRGGR
jgi:hypothetical protein